MRTTNSTKPSSTPARRVLRPSTGAMNLRNHATTVMSTCTAGGTNTHTAGARIATGLTTIMTMTTIPITSFPE
jgi:hypothetical protein